MNYDRGVGLNAGVRAMSLEDRGRQNNSATSKKTSTSRVEFRNAGGSSEVSTSYDIDRSAGSSSSSSCFPTSSGAAAAALRAPPRDVPIFALETLERNANTGGGSITTGAAANNCVIVGTSRLSQLTENLESLAADSGPLPEAVLGAIEGAWESASAGALPAYPR